MIIGPDISAVRKAAKAAVTDYFVRKAEAGGISPVLQARYVLKSTEARRVLAGGTSDYISGEAACRGVTPQEMAQTILDFAKQTEEEELARMRANVAIDAAEDESAVHSVIEPLGVTFTISM